GTRGFLSLDAFRKIGDLGNLGVRVFFVISGYLITSLLLQELEAHGKVDFKAFYLRRAFRIFPAFYAYLAVVAVLSAISILAVPWVDLARAAAYVSNFFSERAWATGHSWSLSVEEQFYLLWPLALFFARSTKGIWVAVFVFAAAPFARIGVWTFMPEDRALIGEAFPTVADAIACGCALAILAPKLSASARYQRFLRSPAFVLVPLVALAMNQLDKHARFFFSVGTSVLDVGIALTVDRCVRVFDGPVGRVLNLRPVRWIGTLSYSLYLWQQLFLNRTSDALVCRFPFNVSLAFLCATCSYYLVERPMLRLRGRIERRRARPVAPPEPARRAA
ncbi:MAG TPA: acyltransferase, partial [Minicystis sp.]|nr:acyltransferase [Minicystis sp.]